MSITADNTIQTNAGSSTGTTNHVVSLPSGTTANNTLLVVTYSPSALTAPAGFTLDNGGGAGGIGYYRKSEIAAGETSWTFTTVGSSDVDWYVEENNNIDPVEPLDVSASGSSASLANGGTLSSGTTSLNAGLSVKVLAAFAAIKSSGDTASWSGYTNGFTEAADVAAPGIHMAVAEFYQDGTTGTFSSTATRATTAGPNSAVSRIVAYRAADAPIMAPLLAFTGFEWGTHAGMGNNTPSNPLGYTLPGAGTWGTNYLIQSGSARNGGYGFRIVNSASAAYVPIPVSPTVPSMAFGFNVRVVSATGTVVVATADIGGTTTDLQVVYDVTNSQYGLRFGTGGTVSYQAGTTATNTWVWIDVRLRTNTTAWHADWRIETGTDTYTDQTSPADNSASATTTGSLYFGATAAQTATIDFDDIVVSKYYAAYPLGPHKVTVLVPETTGASVSGTAANFNEFTANGTLAAFASTSGQRIDEVPPTISASSDGVVQVTAAASDYMNFPMTTYTCAADEIIAAVRALFAEWGGTGTGTGTIGYRGHDGTTETTFVAASASYDADSLTAASATYPLWKQAMWQRNNGWTQAALDAAALRVGFSTDATPDMGISAAYLEVAIRKAPAVRQVTLEDPISATADIYVHPYTSASVSYLITNNDATRSVNFNYSVSGTPQTPVTVSPSSSQTVQVNADNYGDISDLSLEPQ